MVKETILETDYVHFIGLSLVVLLAWDSILFKEHLMASEQLDRARGKPPVNWLKKHHSLD